MILYFEHETLLDKSKQRPKFGKLHFINYGTVVESANRVLSIGNSSKSRKSNQVGTHGEGLKTAILRLLHCGVGVEIYCASMMEGEPGPVLYRWRFFISERIDDRGNLIVKTTFPKPREWTKKARDEIRFHIELTYNRDTFDPFDPDGGRIPEKPDALGLDIWNYLVPVDYIRNRIDRDDYGSLVPNSPGRVWSWHFYICDMPKRLLFGYDLFVKVGRDRDHVSENDLKNGIARVWNKIFETDTADSIALQKRYFDIIYPEKKDNIYWFEHEIMNRLNNKANKILGQMFMEKNPFPVYPICAELKKLWKRSLPGMQFIEVSSKLWSVLCASDGSLYSSELNQIRRTQCISLMDAPTQFDLPPRFAALFPNVVFKDAPDSYISYTMLQGDDSKVLVNWRALLRVTKNEDEILNFLICKLLPSALGASFNVVPLLTPPPPPPLPPPPNIVPLIRNNDEEEEEEEDDDNNTFVVSVEKKRQRSTLSKEELAEPPKGYKWIKTFSIIPK